VSNLLILRRQAPPPLPCNPLHSLLTAVANKMVVVTTNYDTLLEQAFTASTTDVALSLEAAFTPCAANASISAKAR
jgi:hypothetical protein